MTPILRVSLPARSRRPAAGRIAGGPAIVVGLASALLALVPAATGASPLVATAGGVGLRGLASHGLERPGVPTGPDGAVGDSPGRSQEPVPTRAALWGRAREAKAEEVRPPEREAVEQGLFQIEDNYLIERLAAGWRGFHPVFGGLPTGSGLGLGFRFIDEAVGESWVDPGQPNRVDVAWGAVASFKGYLIADLDLRYRNVGGTPLGVAALTRYRRFTQEDFFGLGPTSSEADRTSYLLEDFEAGAEVFWQRPSWLRVGAGFARLDTNTGPGRDERFPSVEEVFPPAQVPGLADQPDYWRTATFAEVDLRDHPFNPRQGGYYGVRLERYDQRDGNGFDFRRYRVDLQQYFPFFHKHRVVALRAQTVLTDVDAGQLVPFFLQPDLGGNSTLRGFRERRFRGGSSVLLTAEYRWEAWIGLDMALFVDTGKVFEDHADIADIDDYEVAYGLGFRFNTAEGVFLRTDLARSSEGIKTYFVFDHVF